ncbi:SUMF1/EgtB/PvdO family nonheme iron enzyme [Aerosakkonemataceae cyanobacterium BLCC-F50]|uniref:SUMF1/EgtB/PvdO family nonheme iron enzyme n=1 Tax=Floridaenema flaviceps BLCC-F50 TaxID=3153642 RepID=A0ABV4XVR9_9CYAN
MAKIALLIGVSEYEPGLNPLPAAVKDVEAMRRVLADSEKGDFTEIQVLENPKKREIEYAIYKLFANRQKHDLLLFYFSGHGVMDEKYKFYLSTRETLKENGTLVKPSVLPASFLHESMNESKSERQVIILDCCFSGAIAKGLTVKDDGAVNLEEQLGGKGRAILTSSSSTQYSFEQEGSELSIYTRYLVEGIDKGAADLDGDGWISADELHEYASSKVTEAAPAMTPKFYPVEEGYKILLAKSPKDDPKLKYRKEVERFAKRGEGKFSVFARRLLNAKRFEWRLSEEEVKAIEEEVLQPFREYERKLHEYEQCLIEAVNEEYPFSESTEADLKEYQTYLALRDEDIAAIEVRVIAPRQALFSQPKPEYREGSDNFSTVIRDDFGTVIRGRGRGKDILRDCEIDCSSSSVYLQPTFPTQRFDFEMATISVVKKGKELTHKIKRSRKQAEFFSEDFGNGVILEMVAIPGGTFLMGSPTDEPESLDDEKPQHSVTIKPFFIGKFQVTQAQWQTVAGFPKVKIDLNREPSNFKGANRPVEQVSWYEAVEFCERLSQKTGRNYRLPSEAEWEYACRAGTTTPFHFGETITTDLANYCGEDRTIDGKLYRGSYDNGPKGIYREQTTEVGSFPANAFGLYDMHGNVWEWCADHWHRNYEGAPTDRSIWLSSDESSIRRLRGGSWFVNPVLCRSAVRNNNIPGNNNDNIGFRVVCGAAWT